jgi:hypothetical protein
MLLHDDNCRGKPNFVSLLTLMWFFSVFSVVQRFGFCP